jgi:hypothetical protein
LPAQVVEGLDDERRRVASRLGSRVMVGMPGSWAERARTARRRRREIRMTEPTAILRRLLILARHPVRCWRRFQPFEVSN